MARYGPEWELIKWIRTFDPHYPSLSAVHIGIRSVRPFALCVPFVDLISYLHRLGTFGTLLFDVLA